MEKFCRWPTLSIALAIVACIATCEALVMRNTLDDTQRGLDRAATDLLRQHGIATATIVSRGALQSRVQTLSAKLQTQATLVERLSKRRVVMVETGSTKPVVAAGEGCLLSAGEQGRIDYERVGYEGGTVIGVARANNTTRGTTLFEGRLTIDAITVEPPYRPDGWQYGVGVGLAASGLAYGALVATPSKSVFGLRMRAAATLIWPTGVTGWLVAEP